MADTPTALSIVLVFTAFANIFSTWSLVKTWKVLRQVKLYLAMLAVANWLEVWFTFTVSLAYEVNASVLGSTLACKFLMMMSTLSQSLVAMAVAALSFHLLLTVITGCQGSALRHALVIGLFSLLSLVLPFTEIAFYNAVKMDSLTTVCMLETDSALQRLAFDLGSSVTLAFFPALAFLLCWTVAATLFFWTRTSTVKADDDKSDFVIVGLIGLTLLLFCLPFHFFRLTIINLSEYFSDWTLHIFTGLLFLLYTRNAASALVCATFNLVYARRHQSSAYASLDPPPAFNGSLTEERQKLVN